MKTQIEKIVATFKSNRTKPSYWVQVVGALIVIGIIVAHYLFGVNLNTNAVLGDVTFIGALIALWGNLTDNSILEQTGNTIKGNPDIYIKTADTVVDALDTAAKQLQTAKTTVTQTVKSAGSAASSASAQSSEVASAYQVAASAAEAGDTSTASSAATLASSLVANLDINAQSVNETTSESASQAS